MRLCLQALLQAALPLDADSLLSPVQSRKQGVITGPYYSASLHGAPDAMLAHSIKAWGARHLNFRILHSPTIHI